MYKVRLRQWGSSKYIKTRAEDAASLPNLLGGGRGGGEHRGPVRLASGLVVDADRLACHLLRKRGLPATAGPKASRPSKIRSRSHHAANQPPLPSFMTIKPPDILYVSEAVLADTRTYVSGRMVDMAFANRGICAPITVTFYTSRNLLREGKHDEAVALLREAPRQMDDLLRRESPRILEDLFMVIAYLRGIPGEPVTKSVKALIRYTAAAAAELGWPPQHPLRRILSGFAMISEQDALAQYDLATRGWKCLIEMLDAHLGVPGCAAIFPKWLRLSEGSGYDVLPGTYLAERQWGVYRGIVAGSGEGSPEAAQELFYLSELERHRAKAHGGSQADLQRLLEWTLQSIPEGKGFNARYNSQLYLAHVHKEQGHIELAEKYLRAGIDNGIKRDGDQHPDCLRRIVKLEEWLIEWGQDEKVAELQPWMNSVRAKLKGQASDHQQPD
jgi:hypothetical protein